MPQTRLKVLMTGGSGYVASLLREEFAERYDLVLADITDKDRDGRQVRGVEFVDFGDTDRSKYQSLFNGVDSVVHLSYKRSSTGGVFHNDVPQIDRFAIENENVVMANNIYRAAYDAGVRRLVVASSNHAADWYEHTLVHSGHMDTVSPADYPVSDNFYGWAKAAYELLSWPYACGKFGRSLEFVQVRIGYPTPVNAAVIMAAGNVPPAGSPVANLKRYLGAHLSPRDCRQLFSKAIETEDISDANGVPFQIVYGISGNTRRFWSLDSARNVLGYRPDDDSEVLYAGDVRKYLLGSDAAVGRLGG